MNAEIIESFAAMVRDKGIDKDILAGIMEEVFGTIVKKKYGEDCKFDVIVNIDRGDIEIYLMREIVEVVDNPNSQISFEEVNLKGNDDELDIGEEYVEKLKLQSFPRKSILLAKQSLFQRLRELDNETKLNEFKKQIGEIVVADIHQFRKNDIVAIQGKTELILPRSEQIPHEKYRKGEPIRAVVKEIRELRNGGYEIIISRTDRQFLRKLFELEVPEIFDGVIQIREIARRPGEKSKVVVESLDKRVDPTGACIGMKGVRIHQISKELGKETVDVINYSPDVKILMQRALAPGKVINIELDEQNRKAEVYVKNDQAPLVLGSKGVNTYLASMITGYDIDIMRDVTDSVPNIELYDIQDKIGVDKKRILNDNGYDSTRDVLLAGVDKLAEIDEFDYEDAEKIVRQIKEICGLNQE